MYGSVYMPSATEAIKFFSSPQREKENVIGIRDSAREKLGGNYAHTHTLFKNNK